MTQTKQMVEFMVQEYAEAMERQNAASPQAPPFNVQAMVGALNSFRQFVRDYLKQYTPQQLLTNVDGNYGVQLTNLKQFLIGLPMEELKGTMQPSHHVHVTGQQTLNDMQASGAIPLTGANNLIPPGAVDFTSASQNKDMTVSQPQVRYDQQHPGVPQ